MSSKAGLDHGLKLRSTGGGLESQHCIKEVWNGCAPTSAVPGAWMVPPWGIPSHPLPRAAEDLKSDFEWCLSRASFGLQS